MSHALTITSSVSSSRASSIAVAVASAAVGEPSVASITGFIASSPSSRARADPARDLPMRRVGLRQISRSVEPLARLEEVLGQIGPAEVDAETLDHASALDDGTAGLPEGAQLVWARLDLVLSDEPQRAVLLVDLTHVSSVGSESRQGHPARH